MQAIPISKGQTVKALTKTNYLKNLKKKNLISCLLTKKTQRDQTKEKTKPITDKNVPATSNSIIKTTSAKSLKGRNASFSSTPPG